MCDDPKQHPAFEAFTAFLTANAVFGKELINLYGEAGEQFADAIPAESARFIRGVVACDVLYSAIIAEAAFRTFGAAGINEAIAQYIECQVEVQAEIPDQVWSHLQNVIKRAEEG